MLFFYRRPDVQNSGQRFGFAQLDESGDTQQAVVFKQNGRAAGIALLNFGRSDEIFSVKSGDDAFGGGGAVFGAGYRVAEHHNLIAQSGLGGAERGELGSDAS